MSIYDDPEKREAFILDAWRWCEEHGSFPYRATDGMWQCRGLVVGPARATAIEAVEAARWILATP